MTRPKVSRLPGCCGCLSSIGGWGRTMARLSWQSIGGFCQVRRALFCSIAHKISSKQPERLPYTLLPSPPSFSSQWARNLKKDKKEDTRIFSVDDWSVFSLVIS